LPDQLFFDIVKMVVALACIVGLIFLIVFVLKRTMPGAIRNPAERVGMQVLGQLSLGNRQRICVVRVQDQTLLLGITEGSINTLAELTTPRSDAEKEADDPKIFAELLAWRKDSGAGGAATPAEPAPPAAKRREEPESDGPMLFAPGERPPR
jgi:flagellar biosynthetic protein FliO